MWRVHGQNQSFIVCIAWMISLTAGCSVLHCPRWNTPTLSSPDLALFSKECSVRSGSLRLTKAEIAYAMAMEAMDRGDADCVDSFFCAAQYAWDEFEQTAVEPNSFHSRASEIYRSSLSAIVTKGQKYGRLDPRRGLRIHTKHGWTTIPIFHHGFPRNADEFDELEVVGEYSAPQLNQTYRHCASGVPVIAVHNRETSAPFQRSRQAFAATLVLRQTASNETASNETASNDSSKESMTVLELYDPLRVSSFVGRASSIPLAGDTSAPIARALSTVQRSYIQAFFQPGIVSPVDKGLFMLEPYQPGKIPVVFIHGLLSDRLTWANMVNELNARPQFVEQYQIWGFEYPTGEPFLNSATLLRRQLGEICAEFDPDNTDKALKQVVLVGHSMGGLISKMQITESGTALWNSISNRQFEHVRMTPETRTKFAEAVYFTPSPIVSRVIFIGTPHRGSALAQRAIGRVGSYLVEQPEELKALHEKLLEENPGAFSEEFTRQVPTSIDMLEPNSKLLQAIDRLPISSTVRMHSIVGKGRWLLGSGDSDGVVPVSSAVHEQSTSITEVSEKHAKLTEDPGVIQQVLSILRDHYLQSLTIPN